MSRTKTYMKKYQQTEKGKKQHRENAALYRERHPERVREQQRRNHQKLRDVHLKRIADYNQTINGYLRRLYGDVKRRCTNPVGRNTCYKHIKNNFKSPNEFVDYVINVLKVDPRGKQIHRIDNKGHYEPGNIIFVPVAKHVRLHRKVG